LAGKHLPVAQIVGRAVREQGDLVAARLQGDGKRQTGPSGADDGNFSTHV
jgi:hypothetical protein